MNLNKFTPSCGIIDRFRRILGRFTQSGNQDDGNNPPLVPRCCLVAGQDP